MNLYQRIGFFGGKHYDLGAIFNYFQAYIIKKFMKKKYKSKLNFQLVSANFRFRAEWKKVTSRAELKIIQLELWLEPARLGLITIT